MRKGCQSCAERRKAIQDAVARMRAQLARKKKAGKETRSTVA